jgi:hypothetical protein
MPYILKRCFAGGSVSGGNNRGVKSLSKRRQQLLPFGTSSKSDFFLLIRGPGGVNAYNCQRENQDPRGQATSEG